MHPGRNDPPAASKRWDPIRSVHMLSTQGENGPIDTAEIETDENLLFRFRFVSQSNSRATCIAYSGYHPEYPLHRKIFQRATTVATSRLRAALKKMKDK